MSEEKDVPDRYIEQALSYGPPMPPGTVESVRERASSKFKSGYSQIVMAFARYISEHEQPPVDIDEQVVRVIITAYNGEERISDERVGFALAAYKAHKAKIA